MKAEGFQFETQHKIRKTLTSLYIKQTKLFGNCSHSLKKIRYTIVSFALEEVGLLPY